MHTNNCTWCNSVERKGLLKNRGILQRELSPLKQPIEQVSLKHIFVVSMLQLHLRQCIGFPNIFLAFCEDLTQDRASSRAGTAREIERL